MFCKGLAGCVHERKWYQTTHQNETTIFPQSKTSHYENVHKVYITAKYKPQINRKTCIMYILCIYFNILYDIFCIVVHIEYTRRAATQH